VLATAIAMQYIVTKLCRSQQAILEDYFIMIFLEVRGKSIYVDLDVDDECSEQC
jgi:hypothetical protein